MTDEEIEATDDEITEEIAVGTIVAQVRNLRKAAAIICISFILALGVGGGVLQRVNADARAREKHALCENGNTFRRYDKERWDFILNLAGPPQSKESADRLAQFTFFINAADKLHDC